MESDESDFCDSDSDNELLDAVLAAVTEVVLDGDARQLREVMETAKQELRNSGEVVGLATAGLLFAVREMSEDCVRVLIHFGADLSMGDERGDTALHLAVRSGNVDMVMALLSRGLGDLYLRNVNGDTALDLACTEINNSIVRLLANHAWTTLAVGETKQEVFYTALVEAASSGNVNAASTLLDVGANVNSNLDEDRGTALHAACESGSEECVNLFLAHDCDVEALRACALQTPLQRSAECGHEGIVKQLLGAGADINRSTDECSTALTVACHYGHEDVVKVLLEQGAAADTENRWGYTPLFMASDNPDIVAQLLRKQVNVDHLCGERGEAALHLATVVGSLETLQLLLEAGADVNLLTEQNESAIWLAAWKGHASVARMLIEYNTNLNDASDGSRVYAYQYVPLEIALGTKHFEVAKLLLLAGAALRNPLYFLSKESGPWKEVPWLRLRKESTIVLQSEGEGHWKWVVEFLKNPRRLKDLCRLSVRKCVGKDIHRKVRSLHIPQQLYGYLLMKSLQ